MDIAWIAVCYNGSFISMAMRISNHGKAVRLATSRLQNARQGKRGTKSQVERQSCETQASQDASDEVASHESTCSACGVLNLICILLARKNWV